MIIDITRPQIGRIYDYMLGGTFNYEADRRAAEAMIALMPAYPRWAWLNRAFLGHVGRRWADEGRKQILDLGSGQPTQGHFNEHMPCAKILFADNDPLSVVRGQQLLAYTPDMAYVEADLRDADALVELAASYFDDDRCLAVGCIGVVYFLANDEVRRLMQRLHAFCSLGAVMALSFPMVPESEEAKLALSAAAKHARIDLYPRMPEQIAELIAPWRFIAAHSLEELFGDGAPSIVHPEHPLHRTRVFGAFAEH